MAKVANFLPELAEFKPQEVWALLGKLRDEIKIGLERIPQGKPPTQADGGLLAIPYPVGRPSRVKLLTCPPQRILACVFAGQNWRAEVLRWNGTGWDKEEETATAKVIKEGKRVFKGTDAFARYINLMADLAGEALGKAGNSDEIDTIAVSYGFPQENKKVAYGIEGALVTDVPAKYWLIEDGGGKCLGEPLLAELQKKGFQPTRIYFANDTIAVALDSLAGEKTLPVSLIIGNGANMAMEFAGRLVNLEIGHARSLGIDSVVNKMGELGLIRVKEPVSLEYYFSGAYQLPRLIASLFLLSGKTPRMVSEGLLRGGGKKAVLNEQIPSRFLQTMKEKGNDSRILDRLITGEMDREKLNRYLRLPAAMRETQHGVDGKEFGIKSRPRRPPPRWGGIEEEDFALIKQTAQLVMSKAVEVAALMITPVLLVGGWQEGQIPAVGSVFWKARVTPDGKIFGEEVMRLASQWLSTVSAPGAERGMRSGIKAVPANELRGVASLALGNIRYGSSITKTSQTFREESQPG